MTPLHSNAPGGSIASYFQLESPAVVNVVGAGGKTGLILALMAELSEAMPVLYTTTTRILQPPPEYGACVIASDDLSMLQRLAAAAGRKFRQRHLRLVAACLTSRPGYLSAVGVDFAAGDIRDCFPIILNEGDGARGMSLKFPRDGEPVLMNGAQYLVAVIGLDCIHRAAGPRSVFRWELLPPHLKSREGEPLSCELAAEILLHPLGVCKDWQPGSRIIVFINKVDAPELDDSAAALAKILLQNRHFPIERVVCGSLNFPRAAAIIACSG